jgi:hypothetical protein
MLDVLEVDDSPAESPKYVATRIGQSRKLLLETGKTVPSGLANRMVRFYQFR